MFFIPATRAAISKNRKLGNKLTISLIIVLSLIIGLRYQVGGDWQIYIENQINSSDTPLGLVISNFFDDVGFEFFSWLSYKLNLGIYGVNLICAAIFSTGLIVFCNSQPRPWLSICISIPYLVIVVSMGYTRQSVAIGFAMLALLSLEKCKLRKFFFLIACAALFHKTAVVLLLLGIPQMLASKKIVNKLATLSFGLAAATSLAYSFLLPRLDRYISGYEDLAYQSQGAGIRVAMCVLPALIFLLSSRRSFNVSPYGKMVWNALSISSILCLIALVLFKSSTAVDRIALYCIPLQLFVGSRIPDMAWASGSKKFARSLVIIVAFAAQFVWLNFAATAFAWIPYKNIIWAS